MPIIRDSLKLYYPDNYFIARYLDLAKFISLLQNHSLFFCRLDNLEDQLEGTTAKPNQEFRKQYLQLNNELDESKNKLDEEAINEHVMFLSELDNKMKSIFYVNCWNRSEFESAALWKIYSDLEKGIMLKSTIERLKDSLKKTSEIIRLSEIHYLNYDKELMPDGNIMYPIVHKHRAYTYENEVRLILEPQLEDFHLAKKPNVYKSGFHIKIDLDILIEEIIIGPTSPDWFIELVQKLVDKYNLKKVIKKSVLS